MRFATFFDGEISILERACFASFIQLGHELAVFAYDRLALPDGVMWQDAASILPRAEFHCVDTGPHRGSCSQFTNRFRYHMIRDTGLTWVDTDIFCLRADWPDAPILIGAQERNMVNGAVLRLPADHPLLRDAIEITERIGRIAVWGLTGPHLLTALVHEHGLEPDVLPIEAFYPVPFSSAPLLLQPSDTVIDWPANSYCVHLWNEQLRSAGYNRVAGPPAGSPLNALLKRIPG